MQPDRLHGIPTGVSKPAASIGSFDDIFEIIFGPITGPA
jgi:hypothetical protein